MKSNPRRWREVTIEELQALWANLRERGVLYNGMTHDALVEKYGPNNLKHVSGHGWYKLTAKEPTK